MAIISYRPATAHPAFIAELRGLAVDSIRGRAPTTVLGAIIRAPDGVTIDALAGQLAISREMVLETIELLEAEDLCERVRSRGRTRVLAFAAFSDRNEHTY